MPVVLFGDGVNTYEVLTPVFGSLAVHVRFARPQHIECTKESMTGTPQPAKLRAVSMAPVDDAAVRQAFHDGDRQAFEALCRPHLDVLYTVALRVLGNASIAEEIAQDALVKAVQNAHRYDPGRPFRPWLLKIAVNLARDRARSAWWRKVLPLTGTFRSEQRAADAALGDSKRDALVREALMRLPHKYREALTLFHLHDMCYAEMTEITGVAVPALKQRVRRGSLMLREKVEVMYPDLVPPRRTIKGEA